MSPSQLSTVTGEGDPRQPHNAAEGPQGKMRVSAQATALVLPGLFPQSQQLVGHGDSEIFSCNRLQMGQYIGQKGGDVPLL